MKQPETHSHTPNPSLCSRKEFKMTHYPKDCKHFPRKSMLALAVSAVLLPGAGWALEFSSAPPGNQMPYVAPNVIISVDDSGSMDWRTSGGNTSGSNERQPPWQSTTKRINVLKYALGGYNGTGGVFRDLTLLPDGKIRLAWQIMHNNGGAPGAATVGSSSTNSMKVLDATHRANFLSFVNGIKASQNTPSHPMFRLADEYMRGALGINSPWAYVPGEQAEPYLACRRSYHIMMTDGRWNAYNSRTSANNNPGPDTNLGNYDGVTKILPDGKIYDVSSGQTRIYRDNAGISSSTDNRAVLADWALKSWADNLQPDIWEPADPAKRLRPSKAYRLAPPTETVGGMDIEKYWNPKYNPATWPHMVTYTIGFSNDAITWPGANNILMPTETVPFGHDGSYPDLINGNRTWPVMNNENRRALDLWHAAINGRGQFYAVSDANDLEKAFRDILAQINEENAAETPRATAATSGSNASRSAVGRYITTYNPDEQWSGAVIAELINPDGSVESAWGGQSTADLLDDEGFDSGNRIILTWNDADEEGVSFEWSSLSTNQKAYLGIEAGTGVPYSEQGAKVVEYLRGDHSLEGYEEDDEGFYPASTPFRERKSRQGDIINSSIWYAPPPASNYAIGGYADFAGSGAGGKRNRTPMLYVGGNDGMLHAFSATEGEEIFAYVPKGVIPTLRELAEPGYIHRYYVDGSPMVGDVATTTTPSAASHWRSMLIGTLGAGGKGYFVLDVTDPENVDASKVKLDNTLSADQPSLGSCPGAGNGNVECDLGHIFSVPVQDATNPMRANQITRLNNNRWAAIMGNGYNSRNQRPVLLIQYLDGDMELVSIPVTGAVYANDNGLSTPRIVDIDGDDRADVVYAGDLLGNMWKFDLTDPENDANWAVAFSGSPLYTAVGPGAGNNRSVPQPITAPPTVKPNNRGASGMMVAFGTGRDVTVEDPYDVEVQTLYGILDSTLYTWRDASDAGSGLKIADGSCAGAPCPASSPVGSGVSMLVEQRVMAEEDGDKNAEGYTFWSLDDPSDEGSSMSAIDWREGNKKGWYLDLPETGERLLKNVDFYAGTNVLSVYTEVPAKGTPPDMQDQLPESCEPVGTNSARQFLTLLNIMDGRRPSIQIMDLTGDGLYNADDMNVSRAEVKPGAQTQTIITDGDSSFIKADDDLLLRLPPELSLRPGWRQLR